MPLLFIAGYSQQLHFCFTCFVRAATATGAAFAAFANCFLHSASTVVGADVAVAVSTERHVHLALSQSAPVPASPSFCLLS